MRLNWKLLRLAIFPLLALVTGAGCSGINASGSMSPATFFLPGLVQASPAAGSPESPKPSPLLLAQSR